MIHGKWKGLFGHRQKCPPSLHPTLERAEGALPPVKDGGVGGGGLSVWRKDEKREGKGIFPPFPQLESLFTGYPVPDSLRWSILLEAVRAYCKLQTNLSGLFEIRWQDVWTWTCFCISSLTCEYSFFIAAREANFEWSKFLLDSEAEGNQINQN